MHSKPVVTVEVHLKPGAQIPVNAIRETVENWLRAEYEDTPLSAGEELRDLQGSTTLPYAESILAIYLADIETTQHEKRKLFFLQNVLLKIRPFAFCEEPAFQPLQIDGPNEQAINLTITQLPHRDFHGLCESLIYKDDVQTRLTRFVLRMINMTRGTGLNQHLLNWNRLVLLHGLSGTGKTTLCRGVAYKLSIQLRGIFSKFVLLELRTSSMFSSWFGESAALVETTFETAFSVASDPYTFVFISIDEIESIAGCRERSMGANEVADAARATNQLLIVLDKMRRMSNILMLCTTNLLEAVDAAFVDRVDHKEHIPNPSLYAAQEILRSSLWELIRCGIIRTSFDELSRLNGEIEFPELINLANRCLGKSGRTLRRLPYVSLALYSATDEYTLQGAIEAIEEAVISDQHGI